MQITWNSLKKKYSPSEKNKIELFIYFKTFYKVTVTNTVWFWYRDIQIYSQEQRV